MTKSGTFVSLSRTYGLTDDGSQVKIDKTRIVTDVFMKNPDCSESREREKG